jgi:hypothetical protein
MSESKDGMSGPLDLEQLERKLQASIKLMKRGRREMERMRRKSRSEQAHPTQS